MKELRLAVLGAEGRGRVYRRAHRPDMGIRVVAACSLSPDRLSIFREVCGEEVLLTDDYGLLLNNPEIDAIFICTPDHLHETHVIAAMEAGKDVFLEKPMAISVESCDRILAVQKRTERKLYIGHNMRFFPVMRKMKELIAGGAIGEIQAIWCRHFISYGGDAYYKDWHSERAHTTGLLLQKGAHDIDIIHWLGGAWTRRVVAMGKLSVYDKLPRRGLDESPPQPPIVFNRENWPPKNTSGYSPIIDVEDHSMVLMELDNGVQCSYEQCHYTPDDHRNYTVIGTEGRIENYGDHSTEDNLAVIHLWNRRMGYSEKGQQSFSIPFLTGDHGGADPLMIDDFLALLRGQQIVGASPMDARMSVAVGHAATQSLRKGSQPMDIFRYADNREFSCSNISTCIS